MSATNRDQPEPMNEVASSEDAATRRGMLQKHFAAHGPLLGGRALWTALGYPSGEAFRQSRRRGRVAVPTHSVAGRRGVFSFTQDVVDWLVAIEAPTQSLPTETASGQKEGEM